MENRHDGGRPSRPDVTIRGVHREFVQKDVAPNIKPRAVIGFAGSPMIRTPPGSRTSNCQTEVLRKNPCPCHSLHTFSARQCSRTFSITPRLCRSPADRMI